MGFSKTMFRRKKNNNKERDRIERDQETNKMKASLKMPPNPPTPTHTHAYPTPIRHGSQHRSIMIATISKREHGCILGVLSFRNGLCRCLGQSRAICDAIRWLSIRKEQHCLDRLGTITLVQHLNALQQTATQEGAPFDADPFNLGRRHALIRCRHVAARQHNGHIRTECNNREAIHIVQLADHKLERLLHEVQLTTHAE